jgi:hypothetical protein
MSTKLILVMIFLFAPGAVASVECHGTGDKALIVTYDDLGKSFTVNGTAFTVNVLEEDNDSGPKGDTKVITYSSEFTNERRSITVYTANGQIVYTKDDAQEDLDCFPSAVWTAASKMEKNDVKISRPWIFGRALKVKLASLNRDSLKTTYVWQKVQNVAKGKLNDVVKSVITKTAGDNPCDMGYQIELQAKMASVNTWKTIKTVSADDTGKVMEVCGE